jgi:putative phage-type endonuclease
VKIIDIPGGQGSEAWHEHRRTHWNASDAPAMMGCSPYKTRNQLLRELKTGVTPEPDAATQRRFDEGHRREALARPVAERIIGDDLYPIVKANGRYSASLDGETLDGLTDFEHKALNDELRAIMVEGCTGANLPLLYRVQMEHQLHCSGAERTLFMASEWSDTGELVDERHCWYYPDPALRRQVLAGWEQFERDLAEYVPQDPAAQVVAAVQEHLPAVSVQVRGTLAVVSNLEPFGVALRAYDPSEPNSP